MSKHLGNLTVTQQNTHSFPAVDEVYGHLTIAAGVSLRAPKLVKVRGWVTIQDVSLAIAEGLDAPALSSVGSLLVKNSSTDIFTLPSLAETRESITLGPLVFLSLPRLQKIGRSLTMKPDSYLDAPVWSAIGGYADIDGSARLLAPKFIGG